MVGDPPRLPRLQVTADHPPPDPRQPVAQLEGVADVPLPRIRGQADRGGELGDRELRHQRRTLTGQRHPLVPERTALLDRVGRVHRRPLHREPAAAGPLPGPRRPGTHAQQSSTADAVSSSITSAAIHENPSTDHRHSEPENPVVDRDVDNKSRNLETVTTAVDPSKPRAGKQPASGPVTTAASNHTIRKIKPDRPR